MRFPLPVLTLSAALVSVIATPFAAQAQFLPHRAVYDLTLASGSRNVEDARGRIVFEFAGDACDGYATSVRQVTTLSGSAGQAQTIDMNSTTFEEADGLALRYRSETRADGTVIERIDGQARIDGQKMLLDLRQPQEEEIVIDEAPAFPVTHLKAMVAAAEEGVPTLAMSVFDGSDDGSTLYDTLAVIGREMEKAESAFPTLSKTRRWPVTLSYFERGEERGEQTPIYVVSFALHENGVSTDLRLDFGDFALRGVLTSLETLPEGDCPAQ